MLSFIKLFRWFGVIFIQIYKYQERRDPKGVCDENEREG